MVIRRQLIIFTFVGACTVTLDFLIYRGLSTFDYINIEGAKAAGFIVGTIFSYFANRFWTFRAKLHASDSFQRFLILYISTLCINVSFNTIGLHLLSDFQYAIHVAFLIATGTSATLNFLGMKFFVFRTRKI